MTAMRRAIHLLLMLTVLWCGSHLGEPAEAHERGAAHASTLEAHMLPGDVDDAGGSPGKSTQVGHHHCPIAPDGHFAPALCEPASVDGPVYARPVAVLESLSPKPPIQPPSA